jgi:tetratricopeptide (TPR) repeat protein/DNA-binding SARP family transcriptional activator
MGTCVTCLDRHDKKATEVGKVATVRFRLLGPVTTIVDGRAHSLPRAQTRGLFAYLLLNASRPVAVDAAIDAMWGGAEPSTARNQISAAVGTIRREWARLGVPEAIAGGPFGYQARIEPERVDALAFEAGLRQALGDEIAGPERAHRLRETLQGWGGPPLQDAAGAFVEVERARLTGLRLTAVEELAEVELSLGQAVDVVGRLTGLIHEHPLRERLRAQLMVALYRCGRTAEALEVFRSGRASLVAELGIEPGPELQSLHERILTRDPDLTPPPPLMAATGSGRTRQVPRQLPVPPPLFTGRSQELAELDKIHDASTVVITAIDGMAGVGKTALAVQAAHQMVERYPDGQLFVDLHGYTDGVAPVEPGAALDFLLRSLGVAGDRIPAELDARAALYRSRLADQRLVIVLDNAAAEAQVRPLLPGSPGCVVLITSRRRLAGLDQTHTLSLDTLPLPDAIALLRQTAGESRLAGQPQAVVVEFAELCGRLPLALRIAAARLRSHPAWDLGYLASRLRDQQHRLLELAAGPRSVTAALDLSYQDLDADLKRTYRRLGLHPGRDIDPYASAALLDATLHDAGRLLEQLLEAHLLQEPGPGRYRFHDLTRAHAAHTAVRDEAEPDGEAALDRLLDYYRHTAAAAMDAAYPDERDYRPRVPPAISPGPALSDPVAALEWLGSELPNLLAAAEYATDHGRPAHLLHLSSILHRHLRTRGPYHDAETLHEYALTTARATGHQAAEVEALTGLGHIHRLQGRYEQATDHLGPALRLARATGHRAAELDALSGLGHVHVTQGRYGQATDDYEQALRLARAAGHHTGELNALIGLGNIHRWQGRHEQAADHYQQALRLARATRHHTGEQDALIGLGDIHRLRGRYEQAADHFEQALRLARAAGHHAGEIDALSGLGIVHRWQGQYEQAAEYYQQALRLAHATGHRTRELPTLTGLCHVRRLQGRYEEAADHYQRLLDLAQQSGNRNYELEAWQGLGRLHMATGHPAAAHTHHNHALALATDLDQPGDQARALDGLAHSHHGLHQPGPARTHWQRALDILTRLGVDHTDEETTVAAIRGHLADLETDTEGSGPSR